MIALLSAVALASWQLPPPEVNWEPITETSHHAELRILSANEEARLRAAFDRDNAWRKFWIAQGLAAADIALTCALLSKGGRELNPIYGKNADCGRIAAIRGGIAVLQYVLARRAIERDPHRAGKALNVTIAIQGVPVAWNLIQLAR